MIQRKGHLGELQRLLKSFPVVAIVGARQIGKTTLARMLSAARKGPVRHFDLEDPRDLGQLADPMLVLERLRGLIISMKFTADRKSFLSCGFSLTGGRFARDFSSSEARRRIF